MTPLERVVDRPTWLLSRANARAQALLGAGFAAQGFRGYQYRLLAALDQYGAGSQAELGRHTGIDRSDVVAALNELAEGGFVRRDPDPADRRRNVVSITRKGRSALDRLDAMLDRVQEAVLEPLDVDERAAFLRLLTRMGG
jgi:MarR family transcriptional regulator, lower aerobic nicotinate degradation pathway regulator